METEASTTAWPSLATYRIVPRIYFPSRLGGVISKVHFQHGRFQTAAEQLGLGLGPVGTRD